MKNHEKAALVNELTAIAKEFGGAQQLRERIAYCVLPAVDHIIDARDREIARLDARIAELEAERDAEVKDAERCRYLREHGVYCLQYEYGELGVGIFTRQGVRRGY